MLPCGLCEKRFSSNDDLNEHLEGHKSQILQEKEIKSEHDSDQDSYEGSLILDCVKEEEQLQVRQDGNQIVEDSQESSSKAGKKHTLREGESSSKTLMCPNCSFKTINKKIFKEHTNLMHLNKFKCDHCPKRYRTKAHLDNHVRETHMIDELSEDEFFCIKMKVQGKAKRRFYECLKCMLQTEAKAEMIQHIRSVHWKLLNEIFKSKGMENYGLGYHKCTECFYETPYVKNLSRHIKAVHQKRREFACDLCKKAFFKKTNLIRHMRSIHITAKSSELHKCSICEYQTIHKYHLKAHLNNTHLKIRNLTCDLCQRQFAMKYDLRKHIEKIHLKKILSFHRCSNCPFRATGKYELVRHIRQVHFSCEICGKLYSSQRSLAEHKKSHQHTKEEPLPPSTQTRLTCHLGEANSFVSKGDGIKREQDSDQDSAEECLVLDCVKEEEQLQDQQDETQGVKDYVEFPLAPSDARDECRTQPLGHLSKLLSCNRGSNCSFRATEQQELLRHVQQVHEGNPQVHEEILSLSCEICGKSYSSPAGLYFHKKTQHLTKEEPSTSTRVPCPLCQSTGHSIFGWTS